MTQKKRLVEVFTAGCFLCAVFRGDRKEGAR